MINNDSKTNKKSNQTICNNKPIKLDTKLKIISTLKKSFEFDIVIKNGIRVNKELIVIYAIPLSYLHNYLHKKRMCFYTIKSCNILGFSINKKVAKAHKRNLLKRRIKAIMYQLTISKYINEYAFVFICRKGITELDFNYLRNQIIYSIDKIKNNQNKSIKTRNNNKYTKNNNKTQRN